MFAFYLVCEGRVDFLMNSHPLILARVLLQLPKLQIPRDGQTKKSRTKGLLFEKQKLAYLKLWTPEEVNKERA